MTISRTDWDAFQANRGLVLGALRDNPGDYFSAREILSFLADSAPDLSTSQIGKILFFCHEDGLVTKQKEGSQHIWAITAAGIAWEPQPYDWRREKRTDPPGGLPKTAPALEALSAPWRPRNGTPVPTPAPTHPWVASPAVTAPAPKPAPITRPLPIHLESKPVPQEEVATANATPPPQKSYADLKIPPASAAPALENTMPAEEPNPALQAEQPSTPQLSDLPKKPIIVPTGMSLTDFLIAEAEHRLAEHTEKTCCGHCHDDDADVIAEAEEARERYIQLLLTVGDQLLGLDPIWQAARALGPNFDLEASYR